MNEHHPPAGSWARNRILRRVVDGAAYLTWREVAIDDLAATADGPVLLVANHFGGFADALVLMSVLPRRPRILADDSIWKAPVVRWVMDWVGAIPVHRGHSGTTDNTDMFAAAHRALADRELVLIFPEGITREEPSIGRVRSGAARIATGARAQGVRGIRVIPVGLHYDDKAAFRSVVYVREGRPIDLDVELGDEHVSHAEVDQLTDLIADRLRDTAPDYDDWREARALQMGAEAFLRSLDPDEAVPVGLRDRLGAWLARRTDVDELVDLCDRYRSALVQAGATDAWAGEGRAILSRRRAVTLLTWLLMLPYAALGLVAWTVPSVLTWLVSRLRLAPAVMATVLPIVVMATFGLTTLGWSWWAWQRSGASGLLAVAVLAPLTFTSLGLVIERGVLWVRWLRNRLNTLGGRGRHLADLRSDVVRSVAGQVSAGLEGVAPPDGSGTGG